MVLNIWMLLLFAFAYLGWLSIIQSGRPIVWTRRMKIQLAMASLGALVIPFVVAAILNRVQSQ